MAYRHGEQFKDNPGRVNLQSSMALSGLLMGYLFIPVWAPDDLSEGTGRLVMAQLVASGVAGHYASYLYRPDEAVPGGVGTGIWTHTVLGFMAGLTVLAFAETGDARAASGILLAGTAVGFGEGLNFFRNRHDSYEKASYDAMGALGGALVPLGLAILFEAGGDLKTLMALTTAGAIGGYALTYHFTAHMTEKPRPARFRGHPGFSLELAPVPEAYARLDARGEPELAMRVRVPGLMYRF
jgi:hypothetical protein